MSLGASEARHTGTRSGVPRDMAGGWNHKEEEPAEGYAKSKEEQKAEHKCWKIRKRERVCW